MSNFVEQEFHTVRGYELKKQNQSGLTPALEDYLEMVYRLCQQDGYARINRLSDSLNVKPSSSSKMVSKLATLGYLEYDSHDNIRLTEEGLATGAYLLNRHEIVERFFLLIGSEHSLEEAELVEHMLHPSTVLKLQQLLTFLSQSPDIARQFGER